MTRYVGANSSEFPYAAVAYIEAAFSDGSRASGTGTLVGRNDVLTASHVIYDPVLGAAESVSVQFGRDGENRAYPTQQAARLNYYEVETDKPGFFTQPESELDIGLISLASAVGDDIGWFSLGDFVSGASYRVTGYPGSYREAAGPRLMEDSGSAELIPGFDLVSLDDLDVNPGNSGGPVWYAGAGGPMVVGSVSTGSWATEVSPHHDVLANWMSANDSLIPSLQRGEQETPFGIVASATSVDEFATLLQSAGWSLPDTLYETLQSRDELLRYPTLESSIDPVIRLYTGMLGREPDRDGVEYWVTQFNEGNGLKDLAGGFVQSGEFNSLAQAYGGGQAGAVEALYQGVLGRSPDAAGRAYWVEELASGRVEVADMALAFTNSSEYEAASYSLVQGAKLSLWGVDLAALRPDELGFGNTLSAAEQADAGALIRLYSGVLDRAPDEAGLDYWLDVLASGQTLVSVAEAFADSSEFAGRADDSASGLVTALYHQVLDRAPDAQGEAFWLEQLERTDFGKGDLALAFTESAEYRTISNAEVANTLADYQQPDLLGVAVDTETYLLG